MPERNKAIDRVARSLIGSHAWMNPPHSLGEHLCSNAPECGLPKDVYEARVKVAETTKQVDDWYVTVVDQMDLQRVYVQACLRHEEALKRGDVACNMAVGDATCGRCLREALLVDDTGAYSMMDDPDLSAPRARPVTAFMGAEYARYVEEHPEVERA